MRTKILLACFLAFLIAIIFVLIVAFHGERFVPFAIAIAVVAVIAPTIGNEKIRTMPAETPTPTVDQLPGLYEYLKTKGIGYLTLFIRDGVIVLHIIQPRWSYSLRDIPKTWEGVPVKFEK